MEDNVITVGKLKTILREKLEEIFDEILEEILKGSQKEEVENRAKVSNQENGLEELDRYTRHNSIVLRGILFVSFFILDT